MGELAKKLDCEPNTGHRRLQVVDVPSSAVNKNPESADGLLSRAYKFAKRTWWVVATVAICVAGYVTDPFGWFPTGRRPTASQRNDPAYWKSTQSTRDLKYQLAEATAMLKAQDRKICEMNKDNPYATTSQTCKDMGY